MMIRSAPPFSINFALIPVPAPPQGDFAAMTDQFGPGTHILYQDVVVPSNATLGFDLYLANRAGIYASPPTLDADIPEPNQQFRMDIMDPTAPLDDVGAGVLANVYQTMPGDAEESGYDRIVYDMKAFRGETVRLRFAQVKGWRPFRAPAPSGCGVPGLVGVPGRRGVV